MTSKREHYSGKSNMASYFFTCFLGLLVISSVLWTMLTDIVFPSYNALAGFTFYRELIDFQYTHSLIEHTYYPPLYTLLVTLGYLVAGPYTFVPVAVNSILTGLALFFVYKICAKRCSRGAGFLAAFILITFPGIYVMSRVPLMEVALIAPVAFSTYLFLCANSFKNRPYSILVGISLGLGMLIKWTFIAYVAGTFFLYLPLRYFVSKKTMTPADRKRRSVNLILCLSISLTLTLAWYFRYLDFGYFFTSILNDPAPLSKTGHFLIYFQFLKNNLLYKYYFVIFILSFFILAVTKNKNLFIFGSMIIICYIIFSLIPAKEIRYFLPILPLFACLISLAVFSISWKPLARLLIFTVLIIGCYNAIIFFRAVPSPWGEFRMVSFSDLGKMRNNFNHILESIKAHKHRGRTVIATSPFNDVLNYNALSEVLIYRLALRHAQGRDLDIVISGFDVVQFKVFPTAVSNVDFLIVTEDVLKADISKYTDWIKGMEKFKSQHLVRGPYSAVYKKDPSYRNLIREKFFVLKKLGPGAAKIIIMKNRTLRNSITFL